jgi:hypothetical protein
MDRFDVFGGNLRQPEATSKSRLPHFWRYNINGLHRSEATEATFLKVSHMREGRGVFSPGTEGVGRRLPQLPHLCVGGCGQRVKLEATLKRRLPQVASEEVL